LQCVGYHHRIVADDADAVCRGPSQVEPLPAADGRG
jgi:hypothetical protein